MPSAWRGAERQRQLHHPAGLHETPYEFHVFEQRYLAEAPESLEHIPLHEQPLVPVRETKVADPPCHEPFDHAGLPGGVVESEAKPAPGAVTQIRHGRQPPCRQRRVGVEEEQPLPRGAGGSGIHLTGTTRGRPAERGSAVGRHDGCNLRIRAAIDHDNLNGRRGRDLLQ